MVNLPQKGQKVCILMVKENKNIFITVKALQNGDLCGNMYATFNVTVN